MGSEMCIRDRNIPKLGKGFEFHANNRFCPGSIPPWASAVAVRVTQNPMPRNNAVNLKKELIFTSCTTTPHSFFTSPYDIDGSEDNT